MTTALPPSRQSHDSHKSRADHSQKAPSNSRKDAVLRAAALVTAEIEQKQKATESSGNAPPGETLSSNSDETPHQTLERDTEDRATPEIGSAAKKMPPSPMVTPPTIPLSLENATSSASKNKGNYSAHSRKQRTSSLDPSSSQGATAKKAHLDDHQYPDNEEEGASPRYRGVPHVYHDLSQVPDQPFVRKKTGGVTQPFPEKLYEMLQAVQNDPPQREIVSWLPHGRAFLVRRPKEFTEEIMPTYVLFLSLLVLSIATFDHVPGLCCCFDLTYSTFFAVFLC